MIGTEREPSQEAEALVDGILLHRVVARGDSEAFQAVYRRHAPVLCLYAISLTGDSASADDLVQEAFLRLLDKALPRDIRNVRLLLCGILRNLFVDEKRKAEVRLRHLPRLEGRLGSPGETSPRLDGLAESISKALAELPWEQREAVLLRYFSDLTFAEIAGVTGEPEPTVKSRVAYGLAKLEVLLSEWGQR